VAFRTGAARWETAEHRRARVRDQLLLDGADPAAWPNAALAAEHVAHHVPEPELLGPDPHAELDGIGARASRYRAELISGRWAVPAGDLIEPTHSRQEESSA